MSENDVLKFAVATALGLRTLVATGVVDGDVATAIKSLLDNTPDGLYDDVEDAELNRLKTVVEAMELLAATFA